MSGRSGKYMFMGKMANMLGVALAIASLITNLLPVGTASAHHAIITATVACQSDGAKLVTWTITNSQAVNQPMEITAISPAITGVGVGTIVTTSVQGTQTFAGNNHSTISLSITGRWADNYSGNYSGSKNLGSNTCPPVTPGTASASAAISGTCSWSQATGSITPVTIALSHASLTINSVTYTTPQTINLGPGSYHYTWAANETGYVGSGSGDLTIGDCTPGTASASAAISGACSWSEATGSITPVTIALSHASLTINNVIYTTPQTINLGPGSYHYTWAANETGYIGSGSGDLTIGDCAPGTASASATISGACSWTQAGGSVTPVTIALSHASLTINSVTYTTPQTINLGPGSYHYTWAANETGYIGSGSGDLTIGDCTPPDASSLVVLGSCSWTVEAGSKTPVSYTLAGASLIITKNGTSDSYGPFITSGSLDLGPGSYSYNWTPLSGYKGGGSGSIVIGDCTPGNATASISTGVCSYSKETGAQTPVTITLTGASFTINNTTYFASTNINLGPGIYPYSWTALSGYIGNGSGDLNVGNCNPADPLVKTANPLIYSTVGELISYTYTLTNIGGVALTGVKVTDDKAVVSCPQDTLAVNESMTCTAYYSIVQGDLDAGFVTNHATSVSDQTGPVYAQATVTGIIRTGLTLDKTVAESTYSQVGDVLHYSYLVTNTGNVTLTNVGVSDDRTTATCPKISLAPAESMTCHATYVVSNADMESEKITNTAYAYGLYGTVPVNSAPDSATVVRFIKIILSARCAADPTVNDAWQVENKNNYSVGFEYALDGGASGTGSVPANSTTSFDTPIAQRGTGVLSLYTDGNLQNSASAASGCTNNPSPEPTPLPTLVPLIPGPGPAAGSPTVLIPVTGVDMGLLGRTLPGTLFGLSFSFFGLGLVLTGLARRQED